MLSDSACLCAEADGTAVLESWHANLDIEGRVAPFECGLLTAIKERTGGAFVDERERSN